MEMIWLNGEVLPMADAKISVEDRGFQFADGVYEVIRIYNGRPFTLDEHLQRLERSCAGIELGEAFDREALSAQIVRFVEANGPVDGMVYLQVTRGVAPRNHIYPARMDPTLLFYTRPLDAAPAPGQGEGVTLQSAPDERWKRCWIKAIALLPNVLAKNAAIAAGADEAVFVDDGFVSECSASNLFAIIGGKIITHPIGSKVLPGVTRLVLTQLAADLGIEWVERPMREAEAKAADELFITSTTRELNWVANWDGRKIANACGPVTRKLHEAFAAKVRRETRPLQEAPVTSSGRRALAPLP